MSNVVIDLTNFKERVGANVPEGRYKVKVDDIEEGKSSKGNPMLTVWFRIVEGDNVDAVLIDRQTLTPNAIFRTVGFMQALGMPTPRKKLQLNTDRLRNRVLYIDVEDGEPYQGRVRSEVRGYAKVEKVDPAEEQPDTTDEDVDLDSLESEVTQEELDLNSAEETTEEKPKAAPKKAAADEDDSEDAVDLDTIEL